MAIKVIGFDLDDTLWDLKPTMIAAERTLDDWLSGKAPRLTYTVREMGSLREEVLSSVPGLSSQITEIRRQVICLALRKSGYDDHEATKISNDAIEVFLHARNQVHFFEGALDVLGQLAGQYILGALSNGNADIHRIGLSDLFTFSFSAEQVGAAKPEPHLFQAALSHADIKPEEMVYVGDHPVHDIEGARKLGIKTILVDRGREPNALHPPHEIITDIRHLPEAIARLTD